jgi:ribonuclease P protein component
MIGRLRHSADFERVRTEGARWRGRYCTLNAARALSRIPEESNAALTRIGYITSKRLGGAVVRNRARRLMREAVRTLSQAAEVPPGWDLVLIAQATIVDGHPRMQDVREEIRWLINKAQTGAARDLRETPPAHGRESSAAP